MAALKIASNKTEHYGAGVKLNIVTLSVDPEEDGVAIELQLDDITTACRE